MAPPPGAPSEAHSRAAYEAERLRRTRLGSTAPDEETLDSSLRIVSARVRRLEAEVGAEEAALVKEQTHEATWGRATSADERRAARSAEAAQLRRLAAQLATARTKLQDERGKLRGSLEDERTKLALALTHGVDQYYTDSRAMRCARSSSDVRGGARLGTLQAEKAKLSGALRTLSAEVEQLEADEARAVEARRELKSALFRREGALDSAR